ncbi:MAG: hypothetical protein WCA58_14930 [Terriglobales bacterium]
MGTPPRRTSLYRRRLHAVICAACFAVVHAAFLAAIPAAIGLLSLGLATPSAGAQELTQHFDRKDVDKGPRALGLVQISDKGKARLVPIAVMMNGKFFDAESYKATPVPMALDFGIVYEGFRAGVSQGIFTITQPGQLNREWIAEGTWLPEGAKPKTDTRKYSAPVIDEGGRDEDHPVLHRRAGGEADKDDDKAAAPKSGAATPSSTPPTSTSSSSAPSGAPASTTSTATPAPGTAPAAKPADAGAAKPSDSASGKTSDAGAAKAPETDASRTSEYGQPLSDPNRPLLRRGKPDAKAHHEPFVNFDDPTEAAAASKQAGKEADAAKAAAAASVQTVTAISDAGGPDPRPYTYDLKPAEEAIYRNKMIELAGEQLRPSAKGSNGAAGAASARKKSSVARNAAVKSAKPEFEDLSLRVFDLSNSNEPVLVLSARTPVPSAAAANSQLPQEITLIARTNLEGELQKLFFQQTDSRHLDLSPRMELIDAVDADGDGRGELLFRRTFDSGSAYAIYRVTADGLWPLWEPTP